MPPAAVIASADAGAQCPLRYAPCLPEPERLVALGFRWWMRGRAEGDIACWERAWSLYSGMLGVTGARMAVSTLSTWVGALGTCARREIEVFPTDCPGFCRDECIAVSMIAACQHGTCPALRACAFALIEQPAIDRVIGHAQAFADTMTGLEQVLSPGSIVTAPVDAKAASPLLQ
jgi:hypothetical protein